MGLGLATLGYGFMLTYEAGGGIIAGLLLAYGFYLASRVNKRFLTAAVSALFLLPHSILLLLQWTKLFDMGSGTLLHTISYSVFILAWLSMSYNYLIAVKQIAIENESSDLARKANFRLYLTGIVLLGAFSLILFNATSIPVLAPFLYVLQYAVILINLLFLHTCFLLITTESQYQKDKATYAEDTKKLLEKKKK